MSILENKLSAFVKRYFVVIAIIFAAFIAISQVFFANTFIFGLVALVFFFIFAILYFDKSFYLLLIISLVFLEGAGAYRYFAFKIANYNVLAFEIFLLAFLIAWLINLATRRISLNFDKSRSVPLLIGFLVWAAVCFAIGLYNGANLTDVVNDSRQLLSYLAFFFVLSLITRRKQVFEIKRAIIYGSLIYCIFFLVLFYFRSFIIHYTGFEVGELGVRFNFRNSAILFFPAAYLFYSIFTTKNSRRQLLYILYFCVVIFTALISENRTLWLALAIILPSMIIYLLAKREIRMTSFLIVTGVAVFFLFLVIQLPIVNQSDIYVSLSKRIISLTNVYRDPSLVFRLEVYEQAYQGIVNSPIIGYGFGVPVKIEHAGVIDEIPYVDNSYLTITYKMGLIGIILYLSYIVSILYSQIKTIRNSKRKSINRFFVQNLFAFIGLIFFSLTTVILINYQVVFLVATLFGVFERYYLMKIKTHA